MEKSISKTTLKFESYWCTFSIDKCYIPLPFSVRIPEDLWNLYLKGTDITPSLKSLVYCILIDVNGLINVNDIKINRLYVKREY